MVITRRQALRSSAFALGGAVVDLQLAKAETAASKPSGQNAGIYRFLVLDRHRFGQGAAHQDGSYPFFDPQHGANTNVVLRARDAQKLALAKRAVEENKIGEIWQTWRGRYT
jgi:hypothetical protein